MTIPSSVNVYVPMQATGAHNGGWLALHDRKALYNAQLCTVAIIKVG